MAKKRKSVRDKTYVDVAVLVESGQTFEGRLDILGGNVTNFLGLEDANKPPVAVAVVHQEERIALYDICLAFDCGSEAVEGIDEVEVDGLVWDGEGGGAVVVVHVVKVPVLAI